MFVSDAWTAASVRVTDYPSKNKKPDPYACNQGTAVGPIAKKISEEPRWFHPECLTKAILLDVYGVAVPTAQDEISFYNAGMILLKHDNMCTFWVLVFSFQCHYTN